MVKLEWKKCEIIETLQKVYGDNASKKSAVYKWITHINKGRDYVEDEAHKQIIYIICQKKISLV